MSGRYLLDTNIVISFLRKDSEIVEKIKGKTEAVHDFMTLGHLMLRFKLPGWEYFHDAKS
jgi:predicted nucleic acid-binding protein